MKRLLLRYIGFLWMLLAVAACQDDAIGSGNGPAVEVDENGCITLHFRTGIPDLVEVNTRAVDPDGLGVRSLWLFCFDQYRHYIGHVQAKVDPTEEAADGNLSGSFQASIPGSSRYIHFIANLNVNDFEDTPNLGRLDKEVIPQFTSTSGLLCYWGYEHFADEAALAAFAGGEAEAVTMYRNQARFRHNRTGNGEELSIKGYALINEYSRGTVAPYNRAADEARDADPFEFATAADITTPTMCAEEDKLLASMPEDVTRYSADNGDARFTFEHENTADNPLHLVFRINTTGGAAEDPNENSDDRYYKIALVDEEGEQIPIVRNHEYIINFKGIPTTMGYDTFEEAVNGTAANNVWVSIDQTIPSIGDGRSEMQVVGETTRIITEKSLNADGTYTIQYTWYDGENTPQTEPEVTWVEGSNTGIAEYEIHNDFHPGSSKADPGEGTITITPTAIGDPQYGTLQIKAGKFVRTVKLISLRNYSFTPVWTSSGVPAKSGETVSIAFTIPEDFPEELFPLDVKISANLFDYNGSGDNQLDVVFEPCEYEINGQTITRTWGYKYVYTVNEPGLHRVDFKTVVDDYDPTTEEDNERIEFFLEAEAFNTVQHFIYMTPKEKAEYYLQMGYHDGSIDNPGTIRWDEEMTNLSQVHVPPIAGQEFHLHFRLVQKQTGWGGNVTYNPIQPTEGDQIRIYVDETKMKPITTGIDLEPCTAPDPDRGYYYIFTVPQNIMGDYDTQGILIRMRTLSSDCETYIRLASANANQPEENGQIYRSAMLTITNDAGGGAKAYHFTASLSISGETGSGSSLTLPYGPDVPVILTVGIPQEVLSHKPEGVTCFIATTHLKPASGETRLTAAEGGYTFTANSTETTLQFVTNTVASAEEITLSEQGDQVAFVPAGLKISNHTLTGSVRMPEDSKGFRIASPFLSLEREDGTRLGVLDATRDGTDVHQATFTLSLRTEYRLDMDEEIYVRFSPYVSGDDSYYQAPVTLRKLQDGEEVVLANRDI